MEIKSYLKPKHSVLIGLIITAVLFIVISYLFYHVFTVGMDDCASACEFWLDVFIPFSMSCTMQCVQKPIPHPLYLPLLFTGSFFVILSILYVIFGKIYQKTKR